MRVKALENSLAQLEDEEVSLLQNEGWFDVEVNNAIDAVNGLAT